MDIKFYKPKDYKKLIINLKECNMYDNIWESKKSIKRKIKKDSHSIIIIKKKKKIIGCIFFVEFGETAMIWRLCVREQYRNQGLGSFLLKKVEKLITSRGLQQVSGFVDTRKTDLHKRYEERGYKKELSYYFIYKNL